MADTLAAHTVNLLKAEYRPHVQVANLPWAPPHFTAPSADLIHQLSDDAEEFGIPVSTVANWTTWITSVIAAVTAGNWFALIPLVAQLASYAPQAWAFIQQLWTVFHGAQPPVPATGPIITGH